MNSLYIYTLKIFPTIFSTECFCMISLRPTEMFFFRAKFVNFLPDTSRVFIYISNLIIAVESKFGHSHRTKSFNQEMVLRWIDFIQKDSWPRRWKANVLKYSLVRSGCRSFISWESGEGGSIDCYLANIFQNGQPQKVAIDLHMTVRGGTIRL